MPSETRTYAPVLSPRDRLEILVGGPAYDAAKATDPLAPRRGR